MIEDELARLISTVGFPIAMCLWFMFRTDKVIKDNTLQTRNLIHYLKMRDK